MKTVIYIAEGSAGVGDNTSVTPGLPTNAAIGDLLVAFVSIRNSGAGMPITPMGWKTFMQSGNLLVCGRFHDGSAMPTFTFNGGVAGATTLARIIALRDAFPDIDRVVDSYADQLNGAAQDIAFPGLTPTRDGCLVLVGGWKQDDCTSVSAPGGIRRLTINTSTTGDDATNTAFGSWQTSAAAVAAGSITVVGGAAAISRGFTLAIRPYVTTFTIPAATDSACNLPEKLEAAAVEAAAAFDSLLGGIKQLVNRVAVRMDGTIGALSVRRYIQYASAPIDPTGVTALSNDPSSVKLEMTGVWLLGASTHTATRATGNEVYQLLDSLLATPSIPHGVRDMSAAEFPSSGGSVPAGGGAGSFYGLTGVTVPDRFGMYVGDGGTVVAGEFTQGPCTFGAAWLTD